MIEKINTNKIQDLLGKTTPRQANHNEVPAKDADASLQVNYASLINKAMQIQQAQDSKAVEQAGRLLQSGQLESPENIRAAAENIVDFGI